MPPSIFDRFKESLEDLNPSWPCGVAISGGGDSVALYRLLLDIAGADNLVLCHFNHNLRSSAVDDELFVRRLAEEHGVRFESDTWQGRKEGNLQQASRWARYEFFQKISKKHNLNAMFLGHTQDDVAETVLMRLGKGSGLTGLTGIRAKTQMNGIKILRPLLDIDRITLRAYLKEIGQTWCEDPSNENNDFQRVRVRRLKDSLAEAGISFQAIGAAAKSLQRAEAVVEKSVESFRKTYVKPLEKGGFSIDKSLLNQPKEVALQTLSDLILATNPAPIAPRTKKRERALEMLEAQNFPVQLGGIEIRQDSKGFVLTKPNLS